MYKKAYQEYLKWCKENNYTPYALRTLERKVYSNHPTMWDKPLKDKIKLWYKYVKPPHPNAVKDYDVWKFYQNYKGKKVSKSHYLKRISKGIKKEQAIKPGYRKSYRKKFYENNNPKVERSVFSSRVLNGWSMEKAVSTPLIYNNKKKSNFLLKNNLK